jgi:energy-coupling factor transporter ATP-binding protein EcfA2
MTVLEEILNWSSDRPLWQRDALRRLVEKGGLAQEDMLDLTEICKGEHGLVEPRVAEVLEARNIPSKGAVQGVATLDAIFHHRGVNALAEDQTLRFGPRLTVVYGDNGAGKTGYIRILKSACRARGREEILGNVASRPAPNHPVVAIRYRVNDEASLREWDGEGDDDFISRVSVFDTQSASVYLTEKTDVAFRPFGLDLFDELVQACKAVRAQLEEEQRVHSASVIAGLTQQVPEGTAVAKLLSNLTVLTKTESVKALATISEEANDHLALLERSLLDLQANDPAKLVQQLKRRAGRVQALGQHVGRVEEALSDHAVTAAFEARTAWRRKREEAGRLREVTLTADLLTGTGSDVWKTLWHSARAFSEEEAYPGQPFPVTTEEARCVLCQQRLDHAAHRLDQFEEFVASTTERELQEARDTFDRRRKAVADVAIRTEALQEVIKDLVLEHEVLVAQTEVALSAMEDRRNAVAAALTTDNELGDACPPPVTIQSKVLAVASQLEERIEALSGDASGEKRNQLNAEAQELRARVFLAQHELAVLDEIERKKRIAAFDQCINDTKTRAITQKSSAVTRAVVTQKLKDSFSAELAGLNFRHVDVELNEVGGAEGVLYHKLVLTRAPGVGLPKVVSEGEQRCLSIAAFFAELSTSDDPSGIVFDDPVSSLDYRWREGVAQRLVQAAKDRQVIVFTHDVVFLLWLKQLAQEQQVEQLDQHVRQLASGAGVCAEELPWVALPVNKKIGYLKNELQAADKLHREGHQSAYEKDAKYLYGLLREAWERALEEVLLCKVVERYRPGVQTQQIRRITDITEEDCRELEAAMTKCSRWLAGHDQAAAARAPIPSPNELKADVEDLERWVGSINKRRR